MLVSATRAGSRQAIAYTKLLLGTVEASFPVIWLPRASFFAFKQSRGFGSYHDDPHIERCPAVTLEPETRELATRSLCAMASCRPFTTAILLPFRPGFSQFWRPFTRHFPAEPFLLRPTSATTPLHGFK